MKYQKILIEKLKNLPYFDKKAVRELSKQYDLKESTVDTYISRLLKHKEIISLKNGFYISTSFYNENKKDISYLFYLANVLRGPSYISSWTALQYYDLVTEVIYSTISVTPKVTRLYKTKIDDFSYQSIKKELFSDFFSVKAKFNFFIASPSKALFDLLYFKTNQFRGVTLNDIEILIEELRIDFNEMEKEEQNKFLLMIKKYIKHE